MINTLGLTKVIIHIIICHYRVLESIVIDQGLLFISKFWSLLYYFLRIKNKLFTAFYLQTNSQTERQNSIIEAYLKAFVN